MLDSVRGWTDTYIQLLQEWVDLYNIEIGDKVLVLQAVRTDDWNDWVPPMENSVGKILTVHRLDLSNGALELSDLFIWPFYALIPLNK